MGGAAAVLGGAMAFAGCENQRSMQAQAVPTRVLVRVVSRDAKIIGSGVGGAMVRITDARTGKVLAEGKQEGATGDTRRIMTTPHERGMTVYDTEGAAGYRAELPLSEPTEVTITGTGPLEYPQAKGSASKTMLLVPGKHVDGEGVVLELNGFIVEVQSPEPGASVVDEVAVTARVRMMCGCPIEPGGLWDANTKEFVARLKADGAVVAVAPLEFSGQTSVFEGSVGVPAEARGADLALEVLVTDPEARNFGRHQIPLDGFAGTG